MNHRTHQIINELKSNISKKYTIQEMRLFGSLARGDANKNSDIDVFLCISELNHDIEVELFDYAYDIELKYDCLIDLIVFDQNSLARKYYITPIYQNILKEGIII